MDSIQFDDLERSKTRAKRLKGSLSRELMRSCALRLNAVFPGAKQVHVVLHPDNVYRIRAVIGEGRRYLAVAEKDTAPTWTSLNLDRDIDLLIRLDWSPRIKKFIREGEEIHSIDLRPASEERKLRNNG